MSAAPALQQDGPLAMICGGGSLPLAVADLVAARGRQVLLFPLRGTADAAGIERYPHHWMHIGQVGEVHASRPRCEAAATWCSSDRWCGRRSGRSASISRHCCCCRGSRRHSAAATIICCRASADSSNRTASVCSARTRWRRKFWCRKVRSAACSHRSAIAPISPWAWTTCVPPDRSTSGRRWWWPASTCSRWRRRKAPMQMLARVAELRASGRVRAPAGSGVLVKAPKPGQDQRFDLPSIGPQTVEGVARAGLAGIAVVAGSTIIAEPERLIAAADRANIFVVGAPRRDRAMSRAAARMSSWWPARSSGDRLGAALIAAVKRRQSGRAVFRRRRRAHGASRACQACFRSAIWRSSALPPSRQACRKS